jgi:hypothetical protein
LKPIYQRCVVNIHVRFPFFQEGSHLLNLVFGPSLTVPKFLEQCRLPVFPCS